MDYRAKLMLGQRGIQEIYEEPKLPEDIKLLEERRAAAEKQLAEITKKEAELIQKAKEDAARRKLKKEMTTIQEEGKAARAAKAGAGKGSKIDLGPGEKALVTKLGSQMANRTNAVSEIDSVISQFEDPTVDEDLKVVAANNLLKRLNDPTASDAVQNAEAARLSPFIEYQIGNMFGPGAFIGRDLKKFVQQLKMSRQKIIAANRDAKATIERIQAGKGIPEPLDYEPVPLAKPNKPAQKTERQKRIEQLKKELGK